MKCIKSCMEFLINKNLIKMAQEWKIFKFFIWYGWRNVLGFMVSCSCFACLMQCVIQSNRWHTHVSPHPGNSMNTYEVLRALLWIHCIVSSSHTRGHCEQKIKLEKVTTLMDQFTGWNIWHTFQLEKLTQTYPCWVCYLRGAMVLNVTSFTDKLLTNCWRSYSYQEILSAWIRPVQF